MYGSFQGEIFLAERSVGGNPVLPYESIGDANVFDVGNSVDKLTVKESISGFRKTAVSVITGQENTFTINFRDIKPINFAILALGLVIDVAGSTVTNEAFPTGLAVGDVLFLDKPGKVSAITLMDNTGSPVTLVLGTHFEHDGYGKIVIKSLGGLTQPLKASTYTVVAIQKVPIQIQSPPERALLFNGVNTAEFNSDGTFKRVRLIYYRIRFNPVETMNWIQESDALSLPVTGDILEDPTKIQSSTQSKVGELIYLDA
ncbi:MAG: hypothetical protein KG003_03180 [Bacteroidetes bacterium]|nr:hypothetical protein [Bacteroidota bacterium]